MNLSQINRKLLMALGMSLDGADIVMDEIERMRIQIEAMEGVVKKVASLNESAGEIGAGMLIQIVTQARAALPPE